MSANGEITRLLQDWSEGDKEALEKLTPILYQELHRMAHRYMRAERPGHTLQTTALINEAYLRLIAWKNARWENRAQFFGVSAQLMRKILVDAARARGGAKRGGGAAKMSFDEGCIVMQGKPRDIIALDEALTRLTELDPRKGRVVELRFFGGLSVEETALVLSTSHRTVEREWTLAKAWLYREITTS